MPEFYQSSARAKQRAANIKPAPAEIEPDLRTKAIVKVAKPTRRRRSYTRHRFGFFDYIWISLFWLGLTFLWGGINGVLLPQLNQQLVDDHYKGTTLGIITALGMIVAIIVQPAAGALSDISRHRWGRRKPFILIGGAISIIGLLLLAAIAAFMHSWWLLLGAYLILQFSDNIAQGAYQGFIPDNVPDGKRGRASGAMGIAQIIGNVAGLAVATYFLDQQQPVMAIMVICIIFVATLIPTLFLVEEEPLREAPTHTPYQTLLHLFGELRQYPDFVRFIISRLFVLTALATITVFALYFLQDVVHTGGGTLTESYTLLGGVVVFFSLLSIFPAVWLSERIGRKKLVIISCVIGAIGMFLLATATNMTQVVIYASLLGIATGSFNSIDWALATDLIPRESAGRFMGISNLAGAGSQALAALFGGSIRDGFNALGETFFQVKNLGYNALFMCGMIYFLLGIYFLLKVHEPKPSKDEEV